MKVPTLVCTIAGLMLAIGLFGFLPIPDYIMLNGVSTAPEKPRLTWESIQNRDTMKQSEEWFNRKLSFRWLWVGIDRQLSYSFFRELPRSATGSLILAGPNDWLFEEQYLSTSLRGGNWNEETCRKYAEQLSRIQTGLSKRGIAFALVVAPSKVEVYPERLPGGVRRLMENRVATTNFSRLRPFLKETGVILYDGPKRFSEWKEKGDLDLFARSGTHWSYLSAARVLQDLRVLLNDQLTVPIPEFVILKQPPAPPLIDDRDLLKASNLLFPGLSAHDIERPLIRQVSPSSGLKLPRILWIHDSFGWQLLELLHEGALVAPTESLFYFKGAYQNPGRTPTNTVPASINWSEYLQQFDAVVLLHTEIATDDKLWGATDALDAFLAH